ncbi:helix-turn-helix domain-containing protein [Arcicella aquatica]|uniref:Helix-turn-helix domain-containing protein n=1 Tax=Arcicella aquatica TaxID=217141 RepID=A0ABU5QVB2_9BACT|nr:helix-turn-helix domain-containing protein [Arcicella aquatica]MEA5261058.1 helix-turn-helix domain-containing protein [Arcicella aquatica]
MHDETNKVEKEKWISDDQAMQLLNIKSKTTLQKLRDEGKIRFSQPQKKIILYDRESIDKYLESNAHKMF